MAGGAGMEMAEEEVGELHQPAALWCDRVATWRRQCELKLNAAQRE